MQAILIRASLSRKRCRGNLHVLGVHVGLRAKCSDLLNCYDDVAAITAAAAAAAAARAEGLITAGNLIFM